MKKRNNLLYVENLKMLTKEMRILIFSRKGQKMKMPLKLDRVRYGRLNIGLGDGVLNLPYQILVKSKSCTCKRHAIVKAFFKT